MRHHLRGDRQPVPADADGACQCPQLHRAHEVRHGTSPDPASSSPARANTIVSTAEQLYEVLKRVAHALSHGQSISILTRDRNLHPAGRRDPRPGAATGGSPHPGRRIARPRARRSPAQAAARRCPRLPPELRARRNRFITESSAELADADADGSPSCSPKRNAHGDRPRRLKTPTCTAPSSTPAPLCRAFSATSCCSWPPKMPMRPCGDQGSSWSWTTYSPACTAGAGSPIASVAGGACLTSSSVRFRARSSRTEDRDCSYGLNESR